MDEPEETIRISNSPCEELKCKNWDLCKVQLWACYAFSMYVSTGGYLQNSKTEPSKRMYDHIHRGSEK